MTSGRTKESSSTRRLEDLLENPMESLEVEFKGWLDLRDNRDKATLAKALMALANHGGGYVVFGFTESGGKYAEATGRPDDLQVYSTDVVNGIVSRFADPVFHCETTIVNSESGTYPVVTVPGGHKTPIRCRRHGPNEEVVQLNKHYVRKPGPKSEDIQDSRDWDQLLKRCLLAQRGELLDQFRLIMLQGEADAPLGRVDGLDNWVTELHRYWSQAVHALPPDSGPTFPHGKFTAAYQLNHPDLTGRPLDSSFLRALTSAKRQFTGWPAFWVPTKSELAPYVNDGALECSLGTADGGAGDAAHSDFWRAEPEGRLGLIRGHQDDDSTSPGSIFTVELPIWRLGEVLMHAHSLANALDIPGAEVTFLARYEGLSGRQLITRSMEWLVPGQYRSRQDVYQGELETDASDIPSLLPELVFKLAAPLMALFGLYELPPRMVRDELSKMQSGRI